MELKLDSLEPRYAKIMAECEPFLITYPGNLSALELNPFGFEVQKERIYSPTTLRSRTVIDDLHRLDSFTFGDQDMLMPRWVMFDCGEFPGVVFGVGKVAKTLADSTREAYQIDDPSFDDRFVPLSMWVAIRCAEEGAWFGHNLSSANLVAKEDALPGLGTISKALGIAVCKATKQYGATQWSSSSLGIHMSLGTMHLLCAYTPAHTHPETFAYRIDVDLQRVCAPLMPGFRKMSEGGDRAIEAEDTQGIQALHADIENGQKYSLRWIERRGDAPQRLWLDRS